MKTEDLIASLVADQSQPQQPPQRALLAILPIGLVAAIIIFTYALDVRPDFPAAIKEWHYFSKLTFSAVIALVGLTFLLRIARPEISTRQAPLWLLFALAPLFIALLAEVSTLPRDEWWRYAVGEKALYCLGLVPLISTAPLVALLLVLRRGAPQNPALAGAVAGFAAGGLGAFVYCFHCNNDSPFYVAIWYVGAIAIVTTVGAVAGRQILRW
ncbi:NrsF family protein [Dongia sp.]|uniref:NrsF family protein n=1 Tax=Dongia sp. TaxID=1977262 RepID=UPI0035B353DF